MPWSRLYEMCTAVYMSRNSAIHISYMLYTHVQIIFMSCTAMYSNTNVAYQSETGYIAGITPKTEVPAVPKHTLFLFFFSFHFRYFF